MPAAHEGVKKDDATFGPYRRGELDAIAEETSETERRAETAERELMAWKTAQFMEQHLGEEYDALIISVQKFGFFVELMEIFVEGIVPIDRIEEITGEQAFYRERDHAIVSGSGSGPAARAAKEKIRPRRHLPPTAQAARKMSGNSATASASAPNGSIRFAAAWSFRLCPEREAFVA